MYGWTEHGEWDDGRGIGALFAFVWGLFWRFLVWVDCLIRWLAWLPIL